MIIMKMMKNTNREYDGNAYADGITDDGERC